jgi:hypothetical protein
MDIRGGQADWAEHRALLDVEVGTGPSIGGRVRVCPNLDHRCPDGAHDAHEPGHTGTVVNVRRAGKAVSHVYLVVFDDPQPECESRIAVSRWWRVTTRPPSWSRPTERAG